MFNQLKQLKDLKDQAKKLQTMLAEETAVGSGAWGKVKITIDGNQKILKTEIDPELLTNQDKLQDAITEAGNDAISKIQRAAAMKMQSSGINFGNFGM